MFLLLFFAKDFQRIIEYDKNMCLHYNASFIFLYQIEIFQLSLSKTFELYSSNEEKRSMICYHLPILYVCELGV